MTKIAGDHPPVIDRAAFILILLSRCEYIFYRGLYRTAYARVSRGVVTDTELQIAQFKLPRHGSDVTNDTLEARMLRSFKEDLPEHHVSPKCIPPPLMAYAVPVVPYGILR